MKTLCFYCGSADEVRSEYLEKAWLMGKMTAERGIAIAYGAGRTGLMGALADGALAAGGEVIGVIPDFFNTPYLAHAGLSRKEVVVGMHQRKARLVELSDAFVALPGGYGTFEELFEMLTWAQIGLHRKPVGVLNACRYFDPLLALIKHAEAEGMIHQKHWDLLVCAEEPQDLLDALARQA